MQSAHQQMKPRIPNAMVILTTAMALMLGACTSASGPKRSTATMGAKGGRISGNAGDQSVTLVVPRKGAKNNTEVLFREHSKLGTGSTDKQLGVTRLGSPVEITATRGALTQGRVTLSYDPAKLPRGATAKQVGIMIFDPELSAWFPLLDARVDARAHRITATAPHFSLFRTFALEPGKKVLNIAGRGIQMTVDSSTTAMGYFQDLITTSAATIVKDLFAIPPEIKCDKPSSTVIAEASTAVGNDSFSACADGDGREVTVNMVNGVAYPIRLDRLPAGVTVTGKDVALGSGDTITLLRNAYWMTKGQRVIAGAKAGSVTVNERMRTARIHGHMDGSAVAFDILLGTLLAFMPALNADKKLLESIIQKTVNSSATMDGGKGLSQAAQTAVGEAVSNTPRNEGKPDAAKQLGRVLGGGDCILDSKEALTKDGTANDRLEAAVKAAQSCAKAVLNEIDATEIVPALLDSLKLVPEIVQSQIAGFSNILTGGKYKLTSVYVDLNRFDPVATLRANYEGTWHAHRRKIVIDEDGSGRYNWSPFLNYDDPSQDPPCATAEPRGCEISFRLTVTPVGATAEVTKSNEPQEWPVGREVHVLSNTEANTMIFDTATNISDYGDGGTNEFCGPRATRYCGA
ncbi:hypothetical protein ACIP2Z_01675 [Streptomyces iakyrus]|uniref:Lipoprotein n=1 Tax=Streptomyces iakyrus TaxID=68219 RepID=A0ABW8F6K0_9ACTN